MPILLTSPKTVASAPDFIQVRDVLINACEEGIHVVLVSNHPKPAWFDPHFANSAVSFQYARGRQNGNIVRTIAEDSLCDPHDVMVLASSRDDIQMAKNGGAILMGAQWSKEHTVRALGIQTTSTDLGTIMRLNTQWGGLWYYQAEQPFYKVKALADLSTFDKNQPMVIFAKQLTATAKHGGAKLNALLAITARSLMMDGYDAMKHIAWGIYPSSSSDNDDSDVLSDFSHRLRTTASKVRFAERGEPLFVRHTASSKRSRVGGNRTDPTEQIQTLHINPHYEGKLSGRHVIVLDDCTTYGLSFGVAAAFLRKAGAAGMTGIALGKFGNCLQYYDIDILDNPYAPVTRFHLKASGAMNGQCNNHVQRDLRDLI